MINRGQFLGALGAGTFLSGCVAPKSARHVVVPKAPGGGDPRIRGPFPILSMPYLEDGSIDYPSLARGVRYTLRSGCPGVIWGQSNDSIDLTTFNEKCRCYATCIKAMKGLRGTLALGCNGKGISDLIDQAKAVEALASQYPDVNLAIIARPPSQATTLEEVEAYYEALAQVAQRPVIIQTYVNETCPTPTIELLVKLAKKYPTIYGYIKEESTNADANICDEVAHKPVIHTVFSAWGGWKWLMQSRRCGSEGLISERCAYAPLLAYIWNQMERGDPNRTLTTAYALYRLLIDQRDIPGGLRGYSLYYLQRQGIFSTTWSRNYKNAVVKEQGTVAVGDSQGWVLQPLVLTPQQRAELDDCYDDMLQFIRENR